MKKRRPRQAKKTAKKRTVKKSTRPHEVEVERNYSVMIGTFSYGGNGGIPNMAFDTAYWIANQMLFLERHPQIDRFGWHDIADTPIPMTRNQMIETARRNGYDYLLIVDSDMAPDLYVNQDGTPVSEREPTAKPFLESSLKFAMERYDRGPVIVAAPYCGPPPIENVYMFLWRNKASDHPEDSDASLEQYTREEASYEVGIAPVAAAPTGLMLIDLRIVEITEPKLEGDNPWFYYQYPDILKTFKHATEDVTFTRDISLRGCQVYGYNPLFCNWDSCRSLEDEVRRKAAVHLGGRRC